MEINAVVCVVLALLCGALGGSAAKAYALKLLKFLKQMYKPSGMIEVYTWSTAGERVHLSDTCGGPGPYDTWRLPRRFFLNQDFVKVQWCLKCDMKQK